MCACTDLVVKYHNEVQVHIVFVAFSQTKHKGVGEGSLILQDLEV